MPPVLQFLDLLGLGGCSPPGQFPRNTDIRSSVEEWQNVKESQGLRKSSQLLLTFGNL